MINNIIKRAEFKLSQHRQMGKNSSLSIFEVAQLLDTVKKGEIMKNSSTQTQQSMFFSYN